MKQEKVTDINMFIDTTNMRYGDEAKRARILLAEVLIRLDRIESKLDKHDEPPIDFSETYGMEKAEKSQKIEPIDDKEELLHLTRNNIDQHDYTLVMCRKLMHKLNELISWINKQNENIK